MHFCSPGSTWRIGRGPPSHLKLWPVQYRNAGTPALQWTDKTGRTALVICALGVCRVGRGVSQGSPEHIRRAGHKGSPGGTHRVEQTLSVVRVGCCCKSSSFTMVKSCSRTWLWRACSLPHGVALQHRGHWGGGASLQWGRSAVWRAEAFPVFHHNSRVQHRRKD